MLWYELQDIARKQGKVDFLTWGEAVRMGVDPATLKAREDAWLDEFERQREAYTTYVMGPDYMGEPKIKTKPLPTQTTEAESVRGQVIAVLKEILDANPALVLKIPDSLKGL